MFASGLVCNSEAVRILTWNNVVIQSIHLADLSYVHTLGAVMRKQLRTYPKGIVSLALMHTGFKPAPKDVRHEMSKLLKETQGRVHHVLVVEDVGLLAQLLITVIRGVMVIGGNNVLYSLETSRQSGIDKTLPLVQRGAGQGGLETESDLRAALAYVTATR